MKAVSGWFQLCMSQYTVLTVILRRFPKARVWPRLPSMSPSLNDADFGFELPLKEIQEHMLNLYFTYVHPYLPIIPKQSFIAAFRYECVFIIFPLTYIFLI